MFDLDALAVEAEEAPPFEFAWNGDRFTMPTLGQMDWRDQSEFWKGTVSSDERLKLLLGPQQFAKFIAKKASTARVAKLIEAWFVYQGITDPESDASTDS